MIWMGCQTSNNQSQTDLQKKHAYSKQAYNELKYHT